MTKLQELINELCPNGVEYRKIKDIAQVGTGSNNGQDADDNGKYPFFVRSQSIKRKNTFEFDEEAIIIPGEGGIGDIFHYVNEKYALHQRVYRIHFVVDFVNVKFAYYYMIANFKSFILKKAVSSTVTSIRKPMIEQFSIPLPPLSVQCEIVRILDRFAEYAAELQARKEQYEYYRNKLLTFNEIQGGVVWKKMSEIGTFYGGLTGKSKKDFVDGNAKFITYMNVYSNIALKTDVNDKVCIAEGEKQNTIQYGDALFTGSSETPDECGMSSVLTIEPKEPLYLNSFCFGFRLNDRETYYPDFLKHLLRSSSVRKQIGKTANGVTRFNVSKKLLEKIKLPLPPLSEQRRIADILDRFDVLTNDLVAGLPAEIAAVKEQYEYYRNKLLTFERLSA